MVNGALTFEGEDLILNVDGDIDLEKDIRVSGRIELTATGTIAVGSVIVTAVAKYTLSPLAQSLSSQSLRMQAAVRASAET